MLNKLLYGALVKLFGKVSIANEGQHATIVPEVTGDGSWQIPSGADHGEQYRVNCPFCKDKKQHLYISYLSYAQPIMAGAVLRIGKLRAQCFRNNCMANLDNVNFLEGQIGLAMTLTGDGMTTSCPINCDEVEEKPALQLSNDVTLDGLRTWVPDWAPIDENTPKPVLEYLAQRRVTAEDVEWLKLGWGPILSPRTGQYINNGKPWVLIPIINNGSLVGVQARCPSCYLKEDGIKYYFHPGCRKRTMLLNLDVARRLGLGVVCEGAFDVLSIGKPGVCTFGHTPSVMQQRLLTSIGQGLIWLPDTDVRDDLNAIDIAKSFVSKWNAEGIFQKGAHVVVLPSKDAGELTRQQVWTEIIKQVPSNMQDFLLTSIIPKI